MSSASVHETVSSITRSNSNKKKTAIQQFQDYHHRSPKQLLEQVPLTLPAAAALTSASQSFSNPANAGTKSLLVISDPTAFCS